MISLAIFTTIEGSGSLNQRCVIISVISIIGFPINLRITHFSVMMPLRFMVSFMILVILLVSPMAMPIVSRITSFGQ